MLEKLLHDPAYVPMKLKELSALLDIPRDQREELREIMDMLVSEGKASISKKGKYGKPEIFAVAGIFSGHPKGFGFVTVESMEQDIFIPPEKTGSALHGDKVLLTIDGAGSEEVLNQAAGRGSGKRAEGQVIRVLERANREVVGLYQKNKNFGFVIPDQIKIGRDIFIPQGKDMGAVSGHKVIVKVTDYGSSDRKPEGVVTEIIGHINDPGTDIESLVRAYGLPEEFPLEVMKQAERIPEQVEEKDKAGRLDLRALPMVTIDGEDAKDLDDAVSLVKESRDGGETVYHLGVHIADVSCYVAEGSPLDREAIKRGTSVYLADRVIPMLPHRLSNGICSLNAGEDRLALSCLMDIDSKGRVIGHRIAETLIYVDRRMTYTAVNAIVTDRDSAVRKEYQEFTELFDQMKELSDLLREQRQKRGAVDFDFPESRIILDERGRAVDIRPHERNAATKIIEDFMLAANETIAEDYFWQEIPFLYRSHEKPDPEKIKRLALFINNFGYTLKLHQGEIHPGELQSLLTKIEGTAEEALLSRLILRSMRQAKYTAENTGHFGLSARYYTHFTSPIRRYPDLQIHRIIKENLKGGLSEKRRVHYERLLPEAAVQCSVLERRAEEAERETDRMKKCEYMEDRIGEEFDGVISGVTNWGFYVELPNTVEGLVHVNELQDDYYVFDEEHLELRGEMTNRSYRLGQKIRVEAIGTDKFARTIDFIPAERRREGGPVGREYKADR
ncbi:ribonuclease R [Lachnospiraceae bacterium 62-35]